MNEMEYKEFYDKVGKINGWNFSKLKCTSEGVKWDFYEQVLNQCKHSDVLLDIGTGGGENVINIASSLNFLVGVDISSGMIETAQTNLKKSDVSNVRFCQVSSADLQFPDEFFDIVSCCHAPFDSKEVSKVLKKGGTFLTQQVSEEDKLNLKQAFGRGQSLKEKDGMLKAQYMKELQEAGFSDVKAYDYNANNYYHRTEDLLFLLMHTPIIPNFGKRHHDMEIVKKFIEENRTKKGIRTNSKRFMIIAKK
ncbi:class I SAM-dependent methyltransferase [Bacillus spongiae]|uniref:Class I SAM-dependent methyltransferase n=1 Tax=Bacillus spongiae TaxID=2683610 RepID=A0ABU8HES2_9BACI